MHAIQDQTNLLTQSEHLTDKQILDVIPMIIACSNQNTTIQNALGECGLIPILSTLLARHGEAAQEKIMHLMMILARHPQNKDYFTPAEAIPLLAIRATRGRPEMKAYALKVLHNLMIDHPMHQHAVYTTMHDRKLIPLLIQGINTQKHPLTLEYELFLLTQLCRWMSREDKKQIIKLTYLSLAQICMGQYPEIPLIIQKNAGIVWLDLTMATKQSQWICQADLWTDQSIPCLIDFLEVLDTLEVRDDQISQTLSIFLLKQLHRLATTHSEAICEAGGLAFLAKILTSPTCLNQMIEAILTLPTLLKTPTNQTAFVAMEGTCTLIRLLNCQFSDSLATDAELPEGNLIVDVSEIAAEATLTKMQVYQMQIQAIKLLNNLMLHHPKAQETVLKLQGIPLFVDWIQRGSEHALVALGCLAHENQRAKNTMRLAGVIPLLMHIIHNRDPADIKTQRTAAVLACLQENNPTNQMAVSLERTRIKVGTAPTLVAYTPPSLWHPTRENQLRREHTPDDARYPL